jgi:hypothetical protein
MEETWHPARLIPVAGIKGQDEQEHRATSTLLAVMGAVPEFGHALLSGLGAPRGRIRPYAELQLRDGEGKLSIPDGALVIERGQRQWRALVEVKTGQAELTGEQVERYLDMARDHGFDCLIRSRTRSRRGLRIARSASTDEKRGEYACTTCHGGGS